MIMWHRCATHGAQPQVTCVHCVTSVNLNTRQAHMLGYWDNELLDVAIGHIQRGNFR